MDKTTEAIKNQRERSFRIGNIVKQNGLIVAIILMFIILSISSPVFLTGQNIINVLNRSAVTGVLAIGMTIVLLAGGLDLSVANVASLSGLFALGLVKYSGMPVFLGIVIAIAFGAGVGLLNGAMITKLKVDPLIATISTMTVILGFIWVYSNGANIAPAPKIYQFVASTKILGLPLLIIIWIAIGVVAELCLKWTKFGRNIYAVGGNEEASRLSGIRTNQVKMWTYVICGALASIAGLLLVTRLQAAIPTAAEGQEMTVIAAAVIGGASLSGGKGNVRGTFIGVLLVSLVSNAINLWGVPAAYDNVFRGAVIGVAALMDAFRNK